MGEVKPQLGTRAEALSSVGACTVGLRHTPAASGQTDLQGLTWEKLDDIHQAARLRVGLKLMHTAGPARAEQAAWKSTLPLGQELGPVEADLMWLETQKSRMKSPVSAESLS